jgi:rubrerythrin
MPRWSPDDIGWGCFDKARLDPEHLRLVKAAGLTEFNAARYTQYLRNVFTGDEEFNQAVGDWQGEEEQHGRVLGRYAELADPAFDFEAAFRRFTEGYVIPIDVAESIRGSRVGELQARCIVESGTSSFYTALAEASAEPVLKEICRHIAADEFRHYRLFFSAIGKYQPVERLSLLRRIRVSIGRVREASDDELAFAYHCANEAGVAYDRARCHQAYSQRAYGLYRFHHTERVVGMVFKATGLHPQSLLGRLTTDWAWKAMQRRAGAGALIPVPADGQSGRIQG